MWTMWAPGVCPTMPSVGKIMYTYPGRKPMLARVLMPTGVLLVGGGRWRRASGMPSGRARPRAEMAGRPSGALAATTASPAAAGDDDESYGNNGDDRLMVDGGNCDTVYCGSGTACVYADDLRGTVHYGCGTVKRWRPRPPGADRRPRGC